MKKGFLLSLLLCHHAVACQFSNNSTSVYSELLLWQVREVGDDNWAQILGPTGTNQQIQYLNAPFQWSPGIRFGVGYGNEDTLWDVTLYDTWYKTHATNQASISTGELHSSFLGNFFAENIAGDGVSGPYYHSAGIRWDVLYNTLDLELGKQIKIDDVLQMRPFIGVKGAVINQSINTNWQEPFNNATKLPITSFSSATENITNNFYGVGPSMGFNSRWRVFHSSNQTFNIVGNISGALLWSHFSIKDVYQNNTPYSIAIINDRLITGVSMVKGYLGIEWTNVLNIPNFNIHLGYEAQDWFNQLRYYNFDMGRTNNSLFMQGGEIGASVSI